MQKPLPERPKKPLLKLFKHSRNSLSNADANVEIVVGRPGKRISIPRIDIDVIGIKQLGDARQHIMTNDNDDNDNDTESDSSVLTPVSGGGGGGGGGKKKSPLSRLSGRLTPSPKSPPPLIVTIDLNPLMPVPSIQNSPGTVKRIVNCLSRGASSSDIGGHLCMYDHNDGNSRYRKLEKTQAIPSRLQQNLDGREYPRLIASWTVNRVKFAEKLVHLFLDVARVYRYVYQVHEKTGHVSYITVNKNTRKPIEDETMAMLRRFGIESPPSVIGRAVERDWFMIDESVIRYIVECIANSINDATFVANVK